MKRIGILLFAIFITGASIAQIGIGTTTPNGKSVLDLTSTEKGLLIPRMTTAQRIAINPAMPARGLLVFDTDNTSFMYWTGSSWQALGVASGGNFWSLTGNALTGTERIGSTNNHPLVMMAAGIPMLRLDTGRIGAVPLARMVGGTEFNLISSGAANTILNGGLNSTDKNEILLGDYNTILNGNKQKIQRAFHGLILSGFGNTMGQPISGTNSYMLIGGGNNNNMIARYGFLGMGEGQQVYGGYASIVNGKSSIVISDYAIIGSGFGNNIGNASNYSMIGGGSSNIIDESGWGFVGNGDNNSINQSLSSSVVGGSNNKIFDAFRSFIGGGGNNYISGTYSQVVSGFSDSVFSNYSGIGSGIKNSIRTNAHSGFIGGGSDNIILSGVNSVVVGGIFNTVDGHNSFIGGGESNIVSKDKSVLAGGKRNEIDATFATISGGGYNKIWPAADSSFIGGGTRNYALAKNAVVAGGRNNGAGALYSAIVGGLTNFAEGQYSFLGGGNTNQVLGDYGTITGGRSNYILPNTNYSSIGGGYKNVVEDESNYSVISGGDSNRIEIAIPFGTIGGGDNNRLIATATGSVIGGGRDNRIEKMNSVVAGGINNWSRGEHSAVLGGNSNEAGGNYSVVLGGAGNVAGGLFAISAGRSCENQHSGVIMFTDNRIERFESKVTNQFLARAGNGALFTDEDTSTVVRAQIHARSEGSTPQLMADQVGDDFARIRLRSFNALTNHWDISAKASAGEFNIFKNGTGNVLKLIPNDATNLMVMSNGARLTTGGAWTNASDRNVKDNISPVDGDEILEKLAAMPVATWHYKTEADSVLHIGPMAQDFKAAFGLGDSDKSIATVDADGVNMAAIQAMYQQVQQLTQRVKELEAKLDGQAGKRRTKN